MVLREAAAGVDHSYGGGDVNKSLLQSAGVAQRLRTDL